MHRIRFDFPGGTAADAAFTNVTLSEGLCHERSGGWVTAAERIPDLGAVVGSHRYRASGSQVIRRDDGALLVSLGDDGLLRVRAAARTLALLEALWAIVRHQLPERPPADEEDATTQIAFWAHARPEPRRTARDLDMPRWQDVRGNYAPATAAAVEALISGGLPLDGGGLVLWHGPPGTGKTTALRALAREWREQAAVHYVTDPDAVLADPGYLQAVLFGDEFADTGDAWRVIVLEDAGELLAPDAKERMGQGLARLLNLTDGFVGQGLRVVVLITGNEPLERLHPAVARPGRCAACVEFGAFDAAAAEAWLAARGVSASPGARPLAELFALADGRAVVPARRGLGFRAA